MISGNSFRYYILSNVEKPSKRRSRNEKPQKLIKELYSYCEYVDSWRGVQLTVGFFAGHRIQVNRPFPSSPGPLFQNEGR